MTILNDTTQISNMALVVGALTYLIKLFIEKKYGLRFASDSEMIEYILDKGIDKALVTTPKLQVLKNKILGKNEKVDPIETIPLPVKEMQREVNNVRVDTGMVLSELQMEIDFLKDKLAKAIPGLDLSNGNEKDEELPLEEPRDLEEPEDKNETWKNFLPKTHPDYIPPKE